MKKRTAFTLILLCLALSVWRITKTLRDSCDVENVTKAINDSPNWTRIPPDDEEGKKRVVRFLEALKTYDLDVIRKALLAYSEEKRGEGNPELISQFYVINRYLFDVPEKELLESNPRFGGWLGVPHDENFINELWPLAFDNQGALVLSDTFRGYLGPRYRALDEFDFFREKYGARKWVTGSKRARGHP